MEIWNFDIKTAPLDQTIYAASECGKVIKTNWIEKRKAWAGFTDKSPPIAWQPFIIPAHPGKDQPAPEEAAPKEDWGIPTILGSHAALDVIRERHRQIYEEGHAKEKDDCQTFGELAGAAAFYAMNAIASHALTEGLRATIAEASQALWPWRRKHWKPTTKRRDLVKAGALIIAEIERLDRAESKSNQTNV